MVVGKQDTLHDTGDLVHQAPACSWSCSSSKTLFYSHLHPFLTAIGCCLASLMLQPSHLPHLKHFQQPQDTLAYHTASLKIFCAQPYPICATRPALKPSAHFLPRPPPSLWAASWPGALR